MVDEKKYIYESPDGGNTVYRRRAGTNQRELIRKGILHQNALRSQLWRDIFRTAETDSVLKDMIAQVEVYHRLKDLP